MTTTKRLFDIALALALAPVAVPIVLLGAMAIRLETPGQAIFAQERLGRHKRRFRLLKLRTMRSGTPQGASHVVGTGGVTRVGRFLRATKIDELPQLWNVLTGDMSFVGPRPGLPIQTDLTEARVEEGVFEAVPGITGLAQVQRIDMSDPKGLAEVDRRYLETRSMALDLWLILRTLTGGGQGDAARRIGGPT